jgi:hypothetical protein
VGGEEGVFHEIGVNVDVHLWFFDLVVPHLFDELIIGRTTGLE